MRVAVCDDDPLYIELITRDTKAVCEELGIECDIRTYDSGEAILDDVRSIEFDIILLDIMLTGISGFDVARDIYEITQGDNIVFISQEEMLVNQCLRFRPFGFIRKRLMKEELREVFERWKRIAPKNFKLCVKEPGDTGIIYVNSQKVIYIEQKLHYLYIHTTERVLKEREKISKYEYLLEDKAFVRCNRSYICNMKYAYGIKKGKMEMVGDTVISVGRSDIKCVKAKYEAYFRMMLF